MLLAFFRLVGGEVAVVNLLEGELDPRQVFIASIFGKLSKHGLERFGKLTFHWLARAVIVAVIGHSVDKEQAQDLDTTTTKLKLFLQVLLDSVLNLHLPNIVPHSTSFIALPHDSTARESDEFVAWLSIDLCNFIAVAVVGSLI